MSERLSEQSIPTTDVLRRTIVGSHLAELPKELIAYLDEHYPVIGVLSVFEVPDDGPAPYAIRQEWVGLSLPVRCRNLDNDGYPVLGVEGLVALENAGRINGLLWWETKYREKRARAGGRKPDFPEVLACFDFLTFSERYARFEPSSNE